MGPRGAVLPRVVLVIAATLAGGGPVVAEDAPGAVRVEQAWARATPPGATVGAGYFALVNEGTEAERLNGAESPLAGRVQVHRTVEADGTTSMKHQEDGVAVPPGARVNFSPGGYHLMLMQLDQPLDKGDRVPVTLHFERAGRVEIELEVRGLTAGTGD